MSRPIIGIDLGTTSSCVAIYEGHAPRIIVNAEGDRTTPSVVGFLEDDRVVVGAPARRQAVMSSGSTITAIKRLVGRRFDSPEVQKIAETTPYPIVKGDAGDAWVAPRGKPISPPEVMAYVLEKLQLAAETDLGVAVGRAVITVPAYFDEAQRQATRDAGTIAGLEVVRLVNEPTAAALAYGLQRGQGETIAVVDLGGGTFDVTIMRVEDGVFEVLATAGDTLLGGEDIDRRLAARLRDEILRAHGFDAATDPTATQRLLVEAEVAKRTLTDVENAAVSLPFLATGPAGPIHLNRSITRSELEALSEDLIERMLEPCRVALADARLTTRHLDHVLLVGGMTRMPVIQRRVEQFFGRAPSRGINPDEAVALGAALESGILAGTLSDVVLVDVAPHTIGVRAAGDRMVPVVRRCSVIPVRARKIFATSEDNQDHVLVEVYQGEQPVASQNRLLARLRLTDLPGGKKGEVHIEVTFAVDASGCLAVSARDVATSRTTQVVVLGRSGLDRETVSMLALQHDIRRTGG